MQILGRSYVRPDIGPLLTSVNLTLLEVFDGLLKEFCSGVKASSFGKHSGSGDAALSSEDAGIPYLLSGYVCQLDDILRPLETEGQSMEDKEESGMDSKLEKVLEMLPALCQGCMKCLRLSKVRKSSSSCSKLCEFVKMHTNCMIN